MNAALFCSVGIVIVRNGEIVDSFYSLIQPEPNYVKYMDYVTKILTMHQFFQKYGLR